MFFVLKPKTHTEPTQKTEFLNQIIKELKLEADVVSQNVFENSFQSNLLGAKWEDSLWYLKLIDQWKSESINENI